MMCDETLPLRLEDSLKSRRSEGKILESRNEREEEEKVSKM